MTVWCALCSDAVTGANFFENVVTANSINYRQLISKFFDASPPVAHETDQLLQEKLFVKFFRK